MLAKFLALCSIIPIFLVQAKSNQIPVVDGVRGGVPKNPTTVTEKHAFQPQVTGKPVAGKLRYIQNTGVCETTPGVFQASGYADLTTSKHMWFWFFAARKNPSTAPLAIWLNGGPGSSSMYGLFQENGPCRINSDESTVSLNPFSWNNDVNMLYIDQPIGAGFSYGTMSVGTTKQAAADVWQMLQIFFNDATFAQYQSRPFALWTESYGGHYGPGFAAFFLQQNAAINAGTLSGKIINLQTLGIGDGITDPLSQYPGYCIYASQNKYNQLVSSSQIASVNNTVFKSGGCLSQIQSCYNTGSTSTCSRAQSYCNDNVLDGCIGDQDVYDVRAPSDDPYPPDITDFLQSSSLTSKIGAESTWTGSNNNVYNNFASTGDWMTNSAPDLETVINAGVRVNIYDGDADYILNYIGVEAMVNNLQTKFSATYGQQAFTNYNVNGNLAGMYKNAGTFSYVRLFGAGHEVPAYGFTNLAVGQAASQMFEQAMKGSPLSST